MTNEDPDELAHPHSLSASEPSRLVHIKYGRTSRSMPICRPLVIIDIAFALLTHISLASFLWCIKPHSHCADVATVHPDAGQPVYRDAPGHIS